MKKSIIILVLAIVASQSFSQSVSRIIGDSVKMYTLGNTGSELIIENDSRFRTGGFLKNKTNGRTEFAYAFDSSYISNDTLYMHRGDGWVPLKLPSGDLSNYIQKETQNPTATLTGGANLELMASGGTLPYTFNWSAGRLAATNSASATANLLTIVVSGASQTFSNPAAGSILSGTKSVAVTRNTNTTYTNLVTTADSKTASATTAVNFYPKRYWFYSSTSTPTSSDVVASAGGSGELTTSKDKVSFSVVITGTTKYVSYAYPSSYGALTSIIISGLESIDAFTQTTVSVTNASGYVQNYYIYTSNNNFNNTTIAFNSVN